MRKWVFWRRVLRDFLAVLGLLAASLSGQLATTLLQRAQADVERIKPLVEEGTLPKASLDAAEERLADAQDQVTLSETLYSPMPLQNMIPAQVEDMMAAAERRVKRQEKIVDARQNLMNMGIISRAEFSGVQHELTARQMVVDLARNRVNLMDELRAMAATEKSMELTAMGNSMIRYDGSADFKLTNLPGIENDFKSRFHRDLPVSAIGQTLVHQSLGLDHRGKVDVALNPEQPEGLWLRRYLEDRHFPYLAFRNAVAGAATAPHIHIGTGSSRLAPSTR